MADISPAAQAVMDAYHAAPIVGVFPQNADALGVSAALRAAADQVAPVAPEYQPGDPPDYEGMMLWHRWSESQLIRRQLLAIAAELEGSNDPA